MEQFERTRKAQIRVLGAEHRSGNGREVLANDHGRSPRAARRRGIFGVGDERQFSGTGLFDAVEAGDFRVGRSVFEAQIESRSDFREFH